MPSALASASSCSKEWPARIRVALLDVDLDLVLEPVALGGSRKTVATVVIILVFFVGSCGFGSSRIGCP